ncbi:hypothetical protein F5887DRAFT_891784 [Amanita rubescens]|nr:hypothetical protein F5887DRAFT_891812 [Amanita rubescens]KAF8335651.1 hypothetical protein F5887DRAFT_891784 [Amanita rubescens]
MSDQLQSSPTDFCAYKNGIKRRKSWNHILEDYIFTPSELLTLSKPQRRSIYISSLEAHIDRLIAQLLGTGFWPGGFDDLEYKWVNAQIAKKGVAATLHHKATASKQKLVELKRAVCI